MRGPPLEPELVKRLVGMAGPLAIMFDEALPK